MHILFFTDNFPPEGNAIASRVFERACYWKQWGHEVTIITSAPNFPEGKLHPTYKNKWYQVETMQGIRVVRVKTFIAKNQGFLLRTLDFLSYIFPAFMAGLIQKKPDVIVATTPQFFVGITAYLFKLFKRSPFVLEVADIWPASIVSVGAMEKNNLIKILEKIELFLYKKATAIVALTDAFKRNMTDRHINPNKISVVINGVDISRYSPGDKNYLLAEKYGISKEHFIVGYIGTHGMAHGLKNVLNTAELLKNNSKILFLFVGTGAERQELIHIANSKQLNNVKFISAQPKSEIPFFWRLCDVALIHLKNDVVFSEVIPSKIFEAMAMGLPLLLASPEGEASKIVIANNAGIWVPAENPTKLSEAINFYYHNAEKRKEFQKNSYASANFYSRERQAKDMLNVLLNVVS